MMTIKDILQKLHSLADKKYKDGQGNFGIKSAGISLGVRIPQLRQLAKEIGKDHALALQLWQQDIHECKLLATLLAEPKKLTEAEMEQWVKDFYSWDICDGACSNLFDKTPYAWQKAKEWAEREPEYEKRAGFTMMATLAVHDKKATDEAFTEFFPLIEKQAGDERNFVKKAVNWALRQIGKRNKNLHSKAIHLAEKIALQNSPAAKWIAADALRELKSEKITAKLK